MEQLLLINPRKRHRKMSAKQRRYFGKHRARRHYSKRRKSNPIRVVHRARRRIHRTHRKHYSRRLRRNPSFRLGMGGVGNMVKNSATGAMGAIAVDLIMGYAGGLLPDTLKNPISATGGLNPAYYLTKGAGAVLLGVVGRKFLRLGATAERMAEGSLVVTLHDAIKSLLPAGLTLGWMNPAMIARNDVRALSGARGMSAYIHEGTLQGMDAYTR